MSTVSAVIPTYQRHDLLIGRALASVFRQTRPVDEVIVVVDGETGVEYRALLGLFDLVQETGTTVRVVNIPRPEYPTDPGSFWSVQGWAARNKGLDLATGDWIAPLDDDDEWTDDHIEVLLDALEREGTDFAYGKSVTPWGQGYGHWPPSGMNFTDGSQVYRRDLGYRYDPTCIERWLPADADLWNRMVAGNVRFTFVDQVVHHYYPNPR